MTTSATGPLPPSVLEALSRYGAPTICNAMEIVAPGRRLIGFTTKPLVIRRVVESAESHRGT